MIAVGKQGEIVNTREAEREKPIGQKLRRKGKENTLEAKGKDPLEGRMMKKPAITP